MTGTRRNRPRLLALLTLAFVLLLGASACGGDDDDDTTAADDNNEETTTTASDDDGTTTTESDDGGGASDEVDTCELLTKADAEAVLGSSVGEAEVQAATGSFLGGCQYVSTSGGTVAVSARPAAEYDATVNVADDDEAVDVGEEAAFSPSLGLFMKLSGQDYMLQIVAFKSGTTPDKATSVAAAEKVAANA